MIRYFEQGILFAHFQIIHSKLFLVQVENSILKTLAYFDMFLYPLTKEEIGLFLEQKTDQSALSIALDQLQQSSRIFCFDQFYSLQNDESLVKRRIEGNLLAEKFLETGYRNAAFLQKFPFVRGVGISGSLSKKFADKETDIDFFIITQSERLWLARTFLHLFKKLTYLAGKQHGFCMNYFIAENALQIAEKNIFTATEVVTLIPVCGDKAMASFFSNNNWVSDYLPAQNIQKKCVNPIQDAWFKRLIETLLDNGFGNWLDDQFMKITARRWKGKENHHKKNMKGDPVGLAITKYCARPNPEHLQKKLLGILSGKLQKMEAAHFLRSEII